MSWLKKLLGETEHAPTHAQAPPPTRTVEPSADGGLRGERVLVADDSLTIQKVLELLLAHEGARVTFVSTAEAALAALAEAPTIVIVASNLAGGGASRVLDAVKSRPGLGATIAVVLKGAFETLPDGILARIGAEDLITKPFTPEALLDRLRALRQEALRGR